MMMMTGKKGMIAALFVVAVMCGVCKNQIEKNPFSICLQKHPQSNPMCPLSMVEEAYGSSAKTIGLITSCSYRDSYMSALEQLGVENYRDGSSKVVCVDEFGAKGDGYTDDTKAFKKAWKKACSLAPSVFLVPQGKKYVVKPAKFSGPCPSVLTVQVSGTIIAPGDPSVWDGLNPRLWLLFHRVDNLTVEGGGAIYGNGEKWWARSCKIKKTSPCQSAPTAVTFESSNNLMVRNLIVENSQQMHIKFKRCFGVEADNLNVTAPRHSPNTDGIHISASAHVVIKNSIIGTGDDCISIVNGSSHIQIENITCGPGHGISIGSLGKWDTGAHVSDVIVDGASLHDTTNGLRIKTWQGGSGYARRITFQNVHMDNVSHPIIIDQYYCDSEKPCPRKTSAVRVTDVAYLSIKGTSATKEAIRFACSETAPCQNIFLEDIDLTLTSGYTPTTFCENASGSSIGPVVPPPCFQNYNRKDGLQLIAEVTRCQPKDEL